MKKKMAVLICLGLSAATGFSAGRNAGIHAPVCRFIDFYIAAERAEMSPVEHVLYSLAVAVNTSEPSRTAHR